MKTRILIIFVLYIQHIFAQNATDYLRFSQSNYTIGTARSSALSGAFGALGADFSSLSTNPAGMGLYKKSDIMITPSINLNSVRSDFKLYSIEDNKSNFNISNFGIVLTANNNPNRWNHIQFGVGVNRIADFNTNTSITAYNYNTSLISIFQDNSFNVYPGNLDPFSTNLAWNTFLLLDTITTSHGLEYISDLNDGGTKQYKDINQSGSINEWLFSLSGSFEDKVYLGASIGIPVLKFKEDSYYSEVDDADTINYFNQFEYNSYLKTSGKGFNFKLGVIVRPIDWFKIGLAFHSPTYYNLNDEYGTTMTSYWDTPPVVNGYTRYSDSSGTVTYDYSIISPMKVIGSIGFNIQKIALIDFDFELVDYSSGNIEENGVDYSDINKSIANGYTTCLNIRGGAEINLNPVFVRLGGAYFGSPYKSVINDGTSYQFSGGLGFKMDNLYFDLAYIKNVFHENYYLYDPGWIDPAKLTKNSNRLIITLGAKF